MQPLLKLQLITVCCAGLLATGTLRGQQADPAASLTVEVEGIEGTAGRLVVALYTGKSSWLEIDEAFRVARKKITGSELTVSFEDLPPGTYAVSVLHDEDGDDEMDMRWLPFPRPDEGAGASRNPRPKAGPPSWKSAAFQLPDAGKTVTVRMYYF
jgi:uncharacterized protein (DUF2141 family)